MEVNDFDAKGKMLAEPVQQDAEVQEDIAEVRGSITIHPWK